MREFKQALYFFTPLRFNRGTVRTQEVKTIGVKSSTAPSPLTLLYFGPIGAIIGMLVGLVFWGCDAVLPPLVAASITVAADLLLTGALHFDGLVDSADGLLGVLDQKRRLEVMDEPTIGAFALGVGCIFLILRWAALASLGSVGNHLGGWVPPVGGLGRAVWLIGGLWCLSRTSMAVFISVFTYARKEGGLVGAFLSQNNKTKRLYCVLAALIGLLITVLMLYGWVDNLAHLWWIPVLIVSSFVGALGVVALAQKRLGGFTGDVLGAAGIISETIGLIVAVGLAGAGKW